MNCHKGIHPKSELLQPVRDAYSEGKPLAWVRVHDLPDYVFFNHSAHVNRGVGCESCHGRIDKMEVVYQAKALTMMWCLDCHRNPDKNLRPLDKITTMGYRPSDPVGVGQLVRKELRDKHNINVNPPTDCSTCHR